MVDEEASVAAEVTLLLEAPICAVRPNMWFVQTQTPVLIPLIGMIDDFPVNMFCRIAQ